MTRRWIYGLAPVALIASFTDNSLTAADRIDPAKATFQRFNSGPPTFAPPPAERQKPKLVENEAKARETAAAIKAQEEANLMRRMAVCDRLKQLALDTGDGKLEEEALRLEHRATEVFRARIKSLSFSKAPAREE